MKFTYETPSEFTDEDIYFRYFTKNSLICVVIAFLLSVLLCKTSELILKTMIPGIALGVILVLVTAAITLIKIPDEEYMKGAGNTIATLLLSIYIRKKTACIHVLGFGDEDGNSDE